MSLQEKGHGTVHLLGHHAPQGAIFQAALSWISIVWGESLGQAHSFHFSLEYPS